MKSKRVDLVSRLENNVDEWERGRISYDEFDARQKHLWDEIREAGPRVENAVLKVLAAKRARARAQGG